MHSWLLQIAVTAAAVACLGRWRLRLHQQRKLLLDALLARLVPGWQAAATGGNGDGDRNRAAAHSADPARLWDLYRNAQTMQQIADYALRNLDALNRTARDGIDRSVVEELHRDATWLRFRALGELARSGFGKR